MERRNKECGVCKKQTVMWKAKTRDHPQMCKDCYNRPKVGDTYQEKKVSYDSTGTPYHKEFRVVSVTPSKIETALANLKPKDKAKVKNGKITLPDLLKQAEKVFNAWIRKRDGLSDGTFKCISCGLFFSTKEMDAGHFRSKKFAPTRFHELNVHGQCVTCNRMKDGNEKLYRVNLISKIGYDLVEYIEHMSITSWKWDREYLLAIIEKYK